MYGKIKSEDGKQYTIEMKVPEQPSTTNNVFVFEKNFRLNISSNLFNIRLSEKQLNQQMSLRPTQFIGLLKSNYPDVIVIELYFTSLNVMLKYDLTDPGMKEQYEIDKLTLDDLVKMQS